MKKKYKIILLILVVIAVLCVIVFTNNKKVSAEVVEIKRSTFLNEIKHTGIVKSEDSYDISSKIGGEVINTVAENTYVNKGDLILEVDSSEFSIKINELNAQKSSNNAQKKMNTPELYKSQITKLETAISQSELEEKNALKDYENGKVLYENGAISKNDLDNLELKLNSIRNKLTSDRESLNLLYETNKPKDGMTEFYDSNNMALDENIKLLNKKIADSKIYAPFSGIITKNLAKKGEIISPMTPVIKLSDSMNFVIESMVLVDDVVSVDIGSSVNIVQKATTGDLEGKGEVISIDSFANDVSSSLGINEKRVKVKVAITDMGSLDIKENYEVDVNIVISRIENAIYVPKTAIFKVDDSNSVFVVENGKAVIRKVVTGQENDMEIEVKEGLEEGVKVVKISSLEGLEEGVKVKEEN